MPLPTVTFNDTYTLTVGNQTLELAYRGDDHEPGNIYIYAPKQKVLMKVDIVFPGWTPFMDLAVSENVMGYLKAHDMILSYDFDWLVSGHFGRLATRKDVEVQKAYMQDIVANAQTALKTRGFHGHRQADRLREPVPALRHLSQGRLAEMRRPDRAEVDRQAGRRRRVDRVALRPGGRGAPDRLSRC